LSVGHEIAAAVQAIDRRENQHILARIHDRAQSSISLIATAASAGM